ncbi:MAG: PaaI family thioesterase [Deferrisomatales bacterium]|nr:PaaI family thioesterase [Deferrisomatales bacterium]
MADGSRRDCWDELRDPEAGEPQFALSAWIAPAPFEELCGLEILEAAEGRAVLRMPFRVKLSQGAGLLHGGAVTTLADTAVAMAIKSLLPEGTHFATVEMTTRFRAPVVRGTAEARARVTRFEGRDLEGEAEVYAEGGTLVATFGSRFRLARGQPQGEAPVKDTPGG